MSDLISRSKIYNYIKTEINPYGKPFEGTAYELGVKLMEYIEQMDDAEYVTDTNVGGKWIPCSERLPEEGEEVLIATETSDKIYFGMYTKRYGFSMREGFICGEDFMWLNTAIAWMPLPEPYKGE